MPEGNLGQIVSQEEIATSVAGVRAWRIAYVSSDQSANAGAKDSKVQF